jgi:uncharacterized NAD(P)/FAD-binding protein YdhS
MNIAAPQAVAVIGAGFSGLICAIHLLLKSSREGPRIYLIERREAFGVGAAYSTDNPGHLLNTRAANMSVFADRPDHFINWLQNRAGTFDGNGSSFVSRRVYRDYLQNLLREIACGADAAGRFYLVPDEVVALKPAGTRYEVHLKVGKVLSVDAAIVATGNPPPHPPNVPDTSFFESSRYIDDPWHPSAFDAVEPQDTIVILGTGLTMIDAVLSLRLRGHEGPVMALSRRGLVPRRHAAAAQPVEHDLPALPLRLSMALRTIKAAVEDAKRAGGNWQDVIDGLRPHTAAYWQGLPLEAKRRFLRHLRPWWDVHRHRLAPQVADRVRELIREGSLVICRGQLFRIGLDGSLDAPTAAVTWRPAGDTLLYRMTAHHVLNCMGPGGDPARSKTPLIPGLVSAGLARPDRLRLGLDVDRAGHLIGRDGTISERLFALGPPTRGVFWEATAVPDIRQLAGAVATTALAALDCPCVAAETV